MCVIDDGKQVHLSVPRFAVTKRTSQIHPTTTHAHLDSNPFLPSFLPSSPPPFLFYMPMEALLMPLK